MRAGEDIDRCSGKRLVDPLPVAGVVERGGSEAPAGQRVGVAMNDADHRLADTVAGEHR
ncbi:hypothetical protein [Accumulibacter sp.]|uniref:hypothetical protein n=1 Tax=Accumulibacter sp. TaxID=2053492 RepID=UPI0025D55B31|nr:hypothetical protein [Accumulibacter sp.]MCM8612995.1 hypothetical protein [Accumulibacter sp.]MCM8637055.1 hypothetical protein [Accumulibacter sp.]MCM8640695.1 hypothetical protein [Accumulibacter sp.]